MNICRSTLGICLLFALGMCKPASTTDVPDQGAGDLALPPKVVSALVNKNPSATLPSSFVGFSIDWSSLLDQLGAPRTGTNPVLVQLLQNLSTSGQGVPLLRIGGDAQDQAWWSPNGGAKPPGITLDLTQDHLDALTALNQATGARFMLGLNLAANDPSLALSLVQAVQSDLPALSIHSYELGNEPDLYSVNGARASTYSFGDYSTELGIHLSSLLPLFDGGHPLSLPAWAGLGWGASFSDLIGTYGNNIDLISMHASPLSACGKNAADSDYPKLHDLLADSSSAAMAAAYMPQLTATLQAGRPFRIGSVSSARCGGAVGVSNTFAAALWAVDLLFNFWSSGASGVMFESNNSGYGATMKFTAAAGGNGKLAFTPQVLPLYYGLLLFSYAAGGKAKLLPTPTITDANIRVWATSDLQDFAGVPGPHVRVLVINKDSTASGTARLSIAPARAKPATLLRLTAPSIDAQKGIQLAGQTFDGSLDGKLQGTFQTETVTPEGTFDYSFVLPAASAALLIVPTS